jgi:N-acetylglutamate synthase-like GNAT family acetyltransferase
MALPLSTPNQAMSKNEMNIRAARPEDVPEILQLVNEHARRGDLLPRTAASIRETMGDWLIAKDTDGTIVACVSLFAYSPVLAEVRSLAVHDRAKGGGWGSTLVKELILEAHRRNIQTLFALTRAVRFFQRNGFQISNRERFPEKVWRDCSNCALINNCDETAVVLHLAHPLIPKERISTAGGRRQFIPPEQHPTPATQLNHPFIGEKAMSKPAVEKVVLAYSADSTPRSSFPGCVRIMGAKSSVSAPTSAREIMKLKGWKKRG